MNMNFGRTFLFAALFNVQMLTLTAESVFSIGTPDGKSAEFKTFRNLEDPRYTYQTSPDVPDMQKCRPFRDADGAEKFFSKPAVFEVGKSSEKDLPFVHPVKKSWWSFSMPELKIIFTPKSKIAENTVLRIGVSDASDMGPIDVEVFLNGKKIGEKKAFNSGVGFGATLAYNPSARGVPVALEFPVGTEIAAVGKKNEILIKARSTAKIAWFTYDYIELTNAPAPKIADLRDEILEDALKFAGTDKFVFSTRGESRDYHWYSNMGKTVYAKTGVPQTDARFNCEMFSRLGGKLGILNLRTGEITYLIDDRDGCVRDPVASFDAKKILFSYRKGKSGTFHLYEIDADGKNLTKLPVAIDGVDDIEPAYLPNGDIVYASTRMGKTVQCFFMPATDIHRWYKSLGKIAVLTHNPDVDSTPAVLPDGRIIYMRWDYNQRNQLAFHHLWTMNPDGSADMTYFGNNKPAHLFISPVPIPDENGVMFTLNRGHAGRDHFGEIAKVVQPFDPSDPYALKFVSGDIPPKFNRPFPLGGGFAAASDGRNAVIFNGDGQYKKVSNLPDEIFKTDREVRMSVTAWKSGRDKTPMKCGIIMQGIIALAPRALPAERPDMADLDAETATVFLQDVYIGRNMAGVKKGSIKKLMIVQVLPTPAHYNGGSNPLNRVGGFALEKILGFVPVEPDGSAYFEVPAHAALAFVAIDENGIAAKRMQSFVNFEPATSSSCVGCHEFRTEAPPQKKGKPMAYGKLAKIEPAAFQSPVSYRRQIQPLLDKYCLECHNSKKTSGGILLDGGLGENFIHSYIALDERKQIVTGRNMFGDMPPYTFGSGSSPFLKKFSPDHCGKKIEPEEMELLRRWLDTGAMQVGAYAALNTGFLHTYMQGGAVRISDTLSQNAAAYAAIENACGKCHTAEASIPKRLFEPKQNYGETIFDYREAFENPAVEKIKYRTADGKVCESKILKDLLYNLSEPEKSLVLTIPLAENAGGSAKPANSHPVVFKDKNDPHYADVLNALRAASELLAKVSPFEDSPNFRTTAGYVEKMRFLKILPADFPHEGKLDARKADAAYFEHVGKNAVIDVPKK